MSCAPGKVDKVFQGMLKEMTPEAAYLSRNEENEPVSLSYI
jgi:hypothetical protein